MALTVNYGSKIIQSDASIYDGVAFHEALRDIEVSDAGMLAPVIHTYKAVQLGAGAIFPAIAFINGWTLQFVAGNFELTGGNYALTINQVANCYVRVTQSAAYSVSSAMGGSSGPTPEQVAAAVWQRSIEAGLSAEMIQRVLVSMLAGKVTGAGTDTEVFRDLADSKARVTVTADESGNRSQVVIDGA